MHLVLGGAEGLQLVDLVQSEVYEASRGSWVTGEADGQIPPHVACRPHNHTPCKPWGMKRFTLPRSVEPT